MVPYMNLFQSDKIIEFWESVKGLKAIKVLYKEAGMEKGRLVGLLYSDNGIKGYLSRRCIVWGGPIISEDIINKKEVFKMLMKSFIEKIKGRAIYIEFRNLFDCSEFHREYTSFGFQFSEHLNFINTLENEDSVKKRMNKSKLKQIKKTLNAGAEIIESENESEIRDFYKLLSELYRTKVKTPLPGLDYFLNFLKYKIGVFLLIKYQNKIVGGLMVGLYDKVIYAINSCKDNKEYKDIYPGVLANWAGIEYGLKNKFIYFDFLGAGKPNEDYGVREFKSKFGGKLVNYGRYKLILNKPLYALGEKAVRIMKRSSLLFF
jgi:serine/alanine adding enzyme